MTIFRFPDTTVYRHYFTKLLTKFTAVSEEQSAIFVNAELRNPKTLTSKSIRNPKTLTNAQFTTIQEIV